MLLYLLAIPRKGAMWATTRSAERAIPEAGRICAAEIFLMCSDIFVLPVLQARCKSSSICSNDMRLCRSNPVGPGGGSFFFCPPRFIQGLELQPVAGAFPTPRSTWNLSICVR